MATGTARALLWAGLLMAVSAASLPGAADADVVCVGDLACAQTCAVGDCVRHHCWPTFHPHSVAPCIWDLLP